MPQAMATPSVLIIGSEAVPFAKTGGLADVLGALPPALARMGWDVTLALPKYRGIAAGSLVERFSLTVGARVIDVGIFEAPLEGGRAILVDVPELFERDGLYVSSNGREHPDNARRFGVFVRAILEHVARRPRPPSIVHAHDWQAGLAPVYLKTLYARHPTLAGIPTIFTIHNLAFQGLFEPNWLPRLDLPWDLFGVDRLEFWGRISLLKGGINFATMVTTVSPTYAREIQTPEFGFGFEGILRRRSADLVGILNGIDTTLWDPAHDPYLPAPFSADNLLGKRQAKAALFAKYGLPTDEAAMTRPLVAMISRMVDQKGFDLLATVRDRVPTLEATFAVLGTGEPRYEEMWKQLARASPERVGVTIGFSEPLAHLLEAAADLFLMPSRFEPCGLSQMYSQRYGTVPVVHAVGGLVDTVEEGVTGFRFDAYTPEALLEALARALAAYRDPDRWRALQLAGMKRDHSWDHSAREYVKMYRRALAEGDGRTHGS